MAFKAERKKTKYAGVFYRETKTKDRVYYVVYKEFGRTKEIKVGKYSEGMRVEHANNIRMSIITSLRLGTDMPDVLKGINTQDGVTFDTVAMDFFQSKELHNSTNAQIKGKYKSQLKPYIGHRYLPHITKRDLLKIQVQMSETKAPKTVNGYIHLIRSIFYYAIDTRLFVGTNPAKGIKDLKTDNRRERFLTQEEVKLLLDAVKHDHTLYLFTLIALSTGARSGSIQAITKKDIDLSNKLLTITDFKNRTTYTGFFNTTLHTLLAKEIDTLQKNDLLIDIPSRTLRRKMKNILDDLFNQGLTKDDRKNRVVIHTLRHTFASQLAINGTPLFTIQKLLNHKDIEQTMRYAKLAPDSGMDMVHSMMQEYFS